MLTKVALFNLIFIEDRGTPVPMTSELGDIRPKTEAGSSDFERPLTVAK